MPQTLDSCKFCWNDSESMGSNFKVVYEDDSFVAFEDRKPASKYHFLVIPKRHIESVRSLQKPDADLVKSMEEIGHVVLNKLDVPLSTRRLGFHIPPFNSVNHLHLHVHALPYLTTTVAAKYPVMPGYNGHSKGLTWFVEVQQAIQILERGKRVGLLPC
ncbi:HIT-like protein [Phlegmacium glaucopus]|nr:HIT-like protein [Phlegmacium glaucopus]